MPAHITLDGVVATLTIETSSPLGLLSPELLDDVDEQLRRVPRAARVLLVRTDAERAFSAGANIRHFADLDGAEMWQAWLEPGQRMLDRLESLPIPTIAVLHGHALGGGLEIALACDLRVAAESAEIAFPETGIAALPGWGGLTRLAASVGRARALDLVLGRRRLSADEAYDWGLVSRVAAAGQLDAVVAAVAAQLAAGAPTAQRISKAIILGATGGPSLTLLAEGLGGGLLNTTAEHAEGVAAFADKRAPRFDTAEVLR